MKENSPVHQLGIFVDRPWGVSEIGGTTPHVDLELAPGEPHPIRALATTDHPARLCSFRGVTVA
jgi:hypothetical protein